MAVSCIRNENYAIYRVVLIIDEWPKFPRPVAFLLTINCNFFIVDLAVGQIPRFTERIISRLRYSSVVTRQIKFGYGVAFARTILLSVLHWQYTV